MIPMDKIKTVPLYFSFLQEFEGPMIQRFVTTFDELFDLVGWHLDISTEVEGDFLTTWGVDGAVRMIRQFERHVARHVNHVNHVNRVCKGQE